MLNKVEKKDKKVLAVLKKNSHINIGANKEYTIKQFANMIGKLFNKKFNLKFNKSYPDGTPRKLLDSSTMYSMGWRPIISVEKGLRKTLEWYKKNTK
jgi:GDP-L-fucose synthase